ncbi:hypothetical protein [Fusobacterium sp. DD26]|uniref:hypothetical protein n=1 Tax=Fusobacterium sp. DD26 TaxID=2789595 RepID=UPI001B8AB3AA|nr:hypothetical protein [Fusobacterium sp. DD26]
MFTRSKRLELEGDKLLVTCKCGHVQKIDLKDYEESVENEEIQKTNNIDRS